MSMPPSTGPARDDLAESVRFVEEIKLTADKLITDNVDRGDIKLLARSLKELRYSFKFFQKYRHCRKVTMFGSARTAPGTPAYQQAVDFGRAMAEQEFMVITGAGPGIMHAGHEGAGVDRSIGLNIVLPFEQSANPIIAKDSKLVNLRYFFTRKLLLVKETDALALFPGGFGTMDEGFEVLTLIQTGKAKIMPVVLIDSPESNYWEKWREYIDHCLYQEGMISKSDFHLFRITHSVEEAVKEITDFYRVYDSQRFVRGELVLRLKKPIGDDLFNGLREEFADILQGGDFRRGDAHPDEANESHLASLPRLYIPFNRKAQGRLRQLIDLINMEA